MKKLKLLFSIVILFVIQSCNDSSNPGFPINENFIYPLKIGNKWNYHISNTFTNPRPDSIQYLLHNFCYDAEVSVTKDTVLNSIPVYEMHEVMSDSNGNFNSYGFYANTQEGLIKYAYISGGSLGLPKANHSMKFLFRGTHYSSITEIIEALEAKIASLKSVYDSLYFFQPPRVIYKYPITQNTEWVFGTGELRLNKQYEGKTTLQTSVGNLECVVIRWKYDLDNDGKWDEDFYVYEYLSTKGKIKMTYTIKDMAITTSEHPDGIGKVDVNYEQIITAINF